MTTERDPSQDCTCLVCGASGLRPVPELWRVLRSMFADRNVVRCSRCGQGRIEPLPDAETLRLLYSDPRYVESYDTAGEAFVVSEETARDQLRSRFDLLDRYLPNRGRMLDIGASRGVFLAQARERGWLPFGIEAGWDAIQYAKTHFDIDIEHGALESAAWPEQSFDCVHLSHVLEHLLDPRAGFQKIQSILKPGGILVVEVPYEFGDLFDRFRAMVLRRPRDPNIVPSSHVHFFTLSSLSRLLVQSGFEVVHGTTLRRNHSYDSRLLLGVPIKRAVYWLERTLCLGPVIEIYARKSFKLDSPHSGS